MIHVETSAEPPFPEGNWEALSSPAVEAALAATVHADIATAPFTAEVSIRLTSDDEVQALNRAYRGKDKPTNVLSFPMVQPDLIETLADTDDGEVLLGDIVVAHGVCVAEAAEKGVLLEAHLTHLIVHGTLHLLGYDHEQGEDEAEAMEEMERAALASLGIDDPYEIRDRGLIYAQLECEHIALNDLTYFVEQCPEDPVSVMIKVQIHAIEQKQVTLH